MWFFCDNCDHKYDQKKKKKNRTTTSSVVLRTFELKQRKSVLTKKKNQLNKKIKTSIMTILTSLNE